MSFVRWGLGALVAAASLHTAAARAADTQSEATGMQQQDPSSSSASPGGAKEFSASGEVKGIDSKALTFADGEQFRLTGDTVFQRDGQKVSRQDIKPGDQARAAYQARNKLAYATEIDANSGGQPSGSAAGPKGAMGRDLSGSKQGTGSMGGAGSSIQGSSISEQGTGSSSSAGTSSDSGPGAATGDQNSTQNNTQGGSQPQSTPKQGG